MHDYLTATRPIAHSRDTSPRANLHRLPLCRVLWTLVFAALIVLAGSPWATAFAVVPADVPEPMTERQRTALLLAGSLPRSLNAVVLLPHGKRILDDLRKRDPTLASLRQPQFDRTMHSWTELSRRLGWTDIDTLERLFGGTGVMVFATHPADAAQPRAPFGDGPIVWALISDVSAETETRLRERLDVLPRAVVAGQAVLSIDRGDILVMLVRKPLADQDERPFWLVITPAAAENDPKNIATDAGERLLRTLSPAFTPADDLPRLRSTSGLAPLRSVGLGQLCGVLRLDDWDSTLTVTIDGAQETARLRGVVMSPKLNDLLAGIPQSNDSLLDVLRRDEGFLVIDSVPLAEIPEATRTVSSLTLSGFWRPRMGRAEGQHAVVAARRVLEPTREDGEPTYRLLWAQQVAPVVKPDDASTAAAGADAVMLKAMSIVETGRFPGPPYFKGKPPSFAGVAPLATRSVMGPSQLASIYHNVFGPRARYCWRVDAAGEPILAVGTACMQGVSAEGQTQADVAAEDRAEQDLREFTAEVRGALSVPGPGRRWISRGFMEPGILRQVVPIFFAPALPGVQVPGQLLSAQWGVWAADASPEFGKAPAGGTPQQLVFDLEVRVAPHVPEATPPVPAAPQP